MPLVQYTGSNIVGVKHDTKELEIFVDEDFVPFMDKMNDSAAARGLKIIVIDAKRNTVNVQGAIVTPAKMSNHLVGGAADVNILIIDTNEYYNSTKLQTCTGIVRDFIDDVKSHGIRWGGDFHTPDPVHFDAGWNINDPELYQQKYKEYFG